MATPPLAAAADPNKHGGKCDICLAAKMEQSMPLTFVAMTMKHLTRKVTHLTTKKEQVITMATPMWKCVSKKVQCPPCHQEARGIEDAVGDGIAAKHQTPTRRKGCTVAVHGICRSVEPRQQRRSSSCISRGAGLTRRASSSSNKRWSTQCHHWYHSCHCYCPYTAERMISPRMKISASALPP